MDSLFDSDTLEVPIEVSSLNADFSIDPDSLNLTENSTVQFQSLSSEAISWLWDFDNGLTDSIPSPLVTFDDPGQYIIYLRTKDSINCVATKEQPLQVVSVLSIQRSNSNSFKIYPNPSSDEIFIQFQDILISGSATFTLYNNKGSVLWHSTDIVENNKSLLNLPRLPSGLYYLHVNIQDHVSIRKLIIK
jgi:PKD repeat protein